MKHDWEYKNFGDCIEKVKYTTKIQSADYGVQGKFPVVSQEEELISGYWDNDADVFHITKPIVIFGDHTRVLKYVDFDFVLGADGVKILQPIEEINAKFLLFYLIWYKIPSLGYSRHYKLLKDITIPVPPLPTQRAIVAELDTLNEILDKKRQQLKELDTLAQSIFYDMFGDPVENEKGWEVKKLGEVAPLSEFKGEHPNRNGKYWLLNLDKVESQTGQIIDVDYYKLEEIGTSVISFDESNVLYSKLRPYLNKVVIPEQIGYATSELVPLKPQRDILNRYYLAYMLRSKAFVSFINIKVAGAKMPRVSMGAFRSFPVPLPPLSLQQTFAEKIEAIEKQKELIKASIAEAETLLAERMEYWFGE